MLRRYNIDFEESIPTIEEIARRFQELTGLELMVEKFDVNAYSLTSCRLKYDVELVIDQTIQLFVVRIILGYLEWAIIRTLQSLGGEVPPNLIPSYARVPWASLPWHKRWFHR